MRTTEEGAISAVWGLFSSATCLTAETHFGGDLEAELALVFLAQILIKSYPYCVIVSSLYLPFFLN